jgi:hypothetical protein
MIGGIKSGLRRPRIKGPVRIISVTGTGSPVNMAWVGMTDNIINGSLGNIFYKDLTADITFDCQNITEGQSVQIIAKQNPLGRKNITFSDNFGKLFDIDTYNMITDPNNYTVIDCIGNPDGKLIVKTVSSGIRITGAFSGRDPARFELLGYSYVELATYSYYFTGSINDGDILAGFIKNDGGDWECKVTLLNPSVINQVTVSTRQFNGDYNHFTTLNIYNDVNRQNLIGQLTPLSPGINNISIVSNTNFDSPIREFWVRATGATTGLMAFAELQFRGYYV